MKKIKSLTNSLNIFLICHMLQSMSDHQEKYAKKFPGKVYG